MRKRGMMPNPTRNQNRPFISYRNPQQQKSPRISRFLYPSQQLTRELLTMRKVQLPGTRQTLAIKFWTVAMDRQLLACGKAPQWTGLDLCGLQQPLDL